MNLLKPLTYLHQNRSKHVVTHKTLLNQRSTGLFWKISVEELDWLPEIQPNNLRRTRFKQSKRYSFTEAVTQITSEIDSFKP
jgi:hypothetical protein